MAKPRLCRFRKFWIVLLLEAWVENYNTCGGVGLFTIIHNYKSVYKSDMKKLNYIAYNHAQHAALIFWIPRDAVHLLMQTPQHHMTSYSTTTNQFPIERKIFIHQILLTSTHTHPTSDRINCVARPTNHFTAKTWSWNMQIWTEVDQRSLQFTYCILYTCHMYIIHKLS